jgi:hypothetical protein
MGEPKAETVSGVEGLRFSSSAVVSGQNLFYSHWVASRNGFAWQLITFGARSSADVVEAEAVDLSNLFELIDPDRVYLKRSATAEDVEAPHLGYAFRVADSGWVNWSDIRDHFPEAHSGAAYGLTCHFGIVPVWLGDFEPTDVELINGLLACVDFQYPESAENERPFTHGGATGWVFDAVRRADDYDFVFRLHVLRRGDFAYLLAGWRQVESGPMEQVDDAVQAVEFFDAEPAAAEFSTAEREAQGTLFRNLGNAAVRGQSTDLGRGGPDAFGDDSRPPHDRHGNAGTCRPPHRRTDHTRRHSVRDGAARPRRVHVQSTRVRRASVDSEPRPIDDSQSIWRLQGLVAVVASTVDGRWLSGQPRPDERVGRSPHFSPGLVASRRKVLWMRARRRRPAEATLNGSSSRPTEAGEADARHYGDAAESW